ncbi:MAG: GntR family transcriptional regulator [Proteobacteria bacterium]|nr:MAG: GntR family transcriptional regulator [Pseudomonadota bacterium]
MPMPDAKSAQINLSSPDHVAQVLLDGIKSGRYVPGQRLIEADLTTELAVSRGPVREALKRLAAEGVVQLIPHRGAYIRKLTRREVMDILVIQETLTALAARLAAENIGANDNRARFQSAYDRLMSFRDRAEAHAVLDERARFYETLAHISANRELSRFVPIVQTNLLRSQLSEHLSVRGRARHFKEYESIAKHILAGNAASAESVMQRHIRNTRLSMDRLDDSAFANELTVLDDQ